MPLKSNSWSTQKIALAVSQGLSFAIGVMIQVAFSVALMRYSLAGYRSTAEALLLSTFIASIAGVILTGFVGQVVAIVFYESLNLRLFATLQRWYRRSFVLFVVLALPLSESLWYDGFGLAYLYLLVFLVCYFIVELLVGAVVYKHLWRRLGRKNFFFHELSIEVIIARIIRKVTESLREEINKYEWIW